MKKLLMVLCSVGFFAGIFLGSGVAFAEHSDNKNCDDFETGEEVMDFWESHDYNEDNDPDGLDRDKDGQPCEELTDGVYDGSDSEDSEESSEDTATEESDEDSEEDTSSEEESSEDADEAAGSDGDDSDSAEEEGGELPDTATNSPFMMMMGALFVGAGGLLLIRKKSLN
ncbi:LPXTG cell wall anchor domain-containing protein [Halobacillus sp. A1]|uniref:LPXTG cell wall anchor domain-containing protein n=1 Tax=Halobacillus sp. A1 TaxID=2880262 RepID=UPI0020A69634|nr:LPXTG cell wall anchor domain-containing protein [Halobacillus sp. A1]MCP3031746.1 LPXTG cell wall anchor domain-containing protein [Halobacillus sp. A1]